MAILVTGGAGFIGSNFVIDWLEQNDEPVVTIDKLTYAGNLTNLQAMIHNKCHTFIRDDISNTVLISQLLRTHKIRALVHFAAESHVDRSIHDPKPFIETNIVGTFNLLECARQYWNDLASEEQKNFRFIQVSTDEVYGSLAHDEPAFKETNAYKPNSPYSASKAAADHLVRAYFHTYSLPVITTNCSNNYGPNQFYEKFIPHCIYSALHGNAIPIYGDGQQIRDWLYVGDHCAAIRTILKQGVAGEMYNIGACNESSNLDLAYRICTLLDKLVPRPYGVSYKELITFVTDRLGHDTRYAIDTGKIERELDWRACETFSSGLEKTVVWYLKNKPWIHTQQETKEFVSA